MSVGPWMTVRSAWQRALYSSDGFYRSQRPADHFRTSTHTSTGFAEAIVGLVRAWGLSGVTDLGAGEGELLTHLHRIAPDVKLVGLEVRPRPTTLPAGVDWHQVEDADVNDPSIYVPRTGLVLANEVLDNVACDIIEVDEQGDRRVVEVQPETGDERLGEQVSAEIGDWLDTWWPATEPGQRAEVGLEREVYWAAVCDRLTDGVAVAVDYGHLKAARPPLGSLMSFRNGRATSTRYDGEHDVTAHVAIDALAARVGGDLTNQRDVLRGLGLLGGRPDPALASEDPAAYLRALSRASDEAELIASPGLGDFAWVITPRHSADATRAAAAPDRAVASAVPSGSMAR